MAPRKAIKEPAPAIASFSYDDVIIGACSYDDVIIEAKQAPPFELNSQALFKSMPQPKSEKKALKDAISFDYKPMDDKRLYLYKDERFYVEVDPKTLSVSVGITL